MKDEDRQDQEDKLCGFENSDTCAYCELPCSNHGEQEEKEEDGQSS